MRSLSSTPLQTESFNPRIMSSPKKQKTNHDEASSSGKEGGDEEPVSPIPALPAPCLAAVLDFLPYRDVRAALVVGRAIAVDATRHVGTLSITRPGELDVRAVRRRFPNITSVNIMCLLSESERDHHGRRGVNISTEVATGIIPFLTSFEKLRKVYLGGYGPTDNGGYTYKPVYRSYYGRDPENHVTVYRSLVDAFCGAFEVNALPRDLDVDCLVGEGEDQMGCHTSHGDGNSPCRLCRRICMTFPFEKVLGLMRRSSSHEEEDDCITVSQQMRLLKQRPGAISFFESEAARDFVMEELKHYLEDAYPYEGVDENDEAKRAFMNRMGHLGAKVVSCCVTVFYIPSKILKLLEPFGIIASKMTREDFLDRYKKAMHYSPSETPILDKHTFNLLVSAGYPFDKEDIILVDCDKDGGFDGMFGDWYRHS